MTAYALTSAHRVAAARAYADLLTDEPHYLYVAGHVDRDGDSVPDASDSWSEAQARSYRDMLVGKLVRTTDVALAIRNVAYQSNSTYAAYDDRDALMETKDFYAVVNAGSYSHVWKCLESPGTPSTVAPDFSDLDPEDETYRTSDGYSWKYLCSAPASAVAKFGDSSFFPLFPNTTVEAAAVPGAIESFAVDSAGEGYDNHLSGTFSSADVRVDGNSVTYAVTGNSAASTVENFYRGCYLYVSGGTGSGQYRRVSSSFSNSNGRFVVVASEFSVPPTNGSEYQVTPAVVLSSSGQETVNCEARAVINSVGNVVQRVEVLSRGRGYQEATATVAADASVGVSTEAEIRPVLAPTGGHGANAAVELFARRVAVSVSLANTESNTVPAAGRFQQFGIVRDPKFQGVTLRLSGASGTFLSGEELRAATLRLLSSNAVAAVGSANVTVSGGSLDLQLLEGDSVLVRSGDGSERFLAEVTSVTNSSHVVLSSSSPFSSSGCDLSLAVLGARAEVGEAATSNSVVVSDSERFSTGDAVVGASSGATGVVDSVEMGGAEKGYLTYVAATRLVGTVQSGTFQENERVYQGSSLEEATSSGALWCTADGVLHLTDVFGDFAADGLVVGADSGATFSVADKYQPEVTFGSGRVTFFQNVSPVEREADETESFRVVLEF